MDTDQILRELKPYLGKSKNCIICNQNKFEAWAKIGYLEAKRCKGCGMISVNPHFNQEGLERFYSRYFCGRLKNLQLCRQREQMYIIDRDWIESFVQGGKILDVGCSGGFFLSKFDPSRWDRTGVEFVQDAAEFAREKFNLPVRFGNIADMKFNKAFNLVTLRGTIEHMSEPIRCLKKCAGLLKKGGCLFITATPAGNSFAFYIYREKWRLFTPLEHIHFFTVDLLTRVLEPLGLKLLARHYHYEETPYADPRRDFEKIKNDIVLSSRGKKGQISDSLPFPGSIMTAVWKKTK